MRGFVAERRFTKVGFLNAHNANVACADPQFAEALRDFLILSDGIGVDIAAKLLYGETFPANLNGTDFIPAFLSRRAAAADDRACSAPSAPTPKPQPQNSARSRRSTISS